ncbi:hypothetical protein ACT89R_01845 [Rhodococcus qingshengii]
MSDLDAEGVIFETVEKLSRVEGFGPWQQTSLDTFANAKLLGFATAYIEITTPDDDNDMIHLISQRLPVQQQHAPTFGG